MLLSSVLLATLLTGPAVPAGFPLVSVAQSVPAPTARLVKGDDAEEAEEEEGSDGCLTDWLCYKPPSGPGVTEWVSDNAMKYLVVRDILIFGLNFFLPFAGVWLPLILHVVMVDEAVRPSMGDMLVPLILLPLAAWGLSIVSFPLNFLPAIGWLLYLGLNYGFSYWVIPVTTLHYYDRLARKSAAAPSDAPSKEGDQAAPPRDSAAPAPEPAPVPAAEPAPVPAAEPPPAGTSAPAPAPK